MSSYLTPKTKLKNQKKKIKQEIKEFNAKDTKLTAETQNTEN